jgi:hypothetical protein
MLDLLQGDSNRACDPVQDIDFFWLGIWTEAIDNSRADRENRIRELKQDFGPEAFRLPQTSAQALTAPQKKATLDGHHPPPNRSPSTSIRLPYCMIRAYKKGCSTVLEAPSSLDCARLFKITRQHDPRGWCLGELSPSERNEDC